MLDTNVLISAALKPLGQQASVINRIAFRAVELFVSPAVLAEYREVFSRPKFAQIPPAQIAILLAVIESEATMVTPAERLAISAHESDNRFYECDDDDADYIVTGNKKHFTKPHKNTRIITGRQLLELLNTGPEEPE